MRDRLSPPPGTPNNQEISVTLADGRTFAVCSQGQYKYLLEQARNLIIAQMIDDGIVTDDIDANEAVVAQKLEDWQENKSQFAPLDWILDRMSNAEREEWKMKYRFGGVTRKVR